MTTPPEDPLVRSARREALIVTAIFLAAMIYTLTYCGIHAYGRNPDDIQLVLGFPDWVFWGILTPWTVCTVVSVVFAFGFMTDDPLGAAAENWNPDGADPLTDEQPPRHA